MQVTVRAPQVRADPIFVSGYETVGAPVVLDLVGTAFAGGGIVLAGRTLTVSGTRPSG